MRAGEPRKEKKKLLSHIVKVSREEKGRLVLKGWIVAEIRFRKGTFGRSKSETEAYRYIIRF